MDYAVRFTGAAAWRDMHAPPPRLGRLRRESAGMFRIRRGPYCASYRIDDVSELDEAWLDGVATVSVTSGASVPDHLVTEVLAYGTAVVVEPA